MAWDPNSSPWDWETDGVIVPNHVNGVDPRKLLIASWPCETELSQNKQDGPLSQNNRALCSSDVNPGNAISQNVRMDVMRDGNIHANRVVTPAMSNIHGSMVFNDVTSHGTIGPVLQARVPIVTTCIGSGAFIGGSDHGNGSLASIVQNRPNESEGSAEHTNVQGLGAHDYPGSAESNTKLGFQQTSLVEDELRLVVKSNGRDNLAVSKHLSDKSMGSICNGDKANVIDEQHSSKAKGSAGSGDSLTGLQLGKRTYPLDVAAPTAVAKATPKLQTVAKKARGSSVAAQVPRCQVEGCKLDLSSAKDYHRRHKVCEPHSKAGKVVVASLEQRFCQQCSRFHVLTEFDETKRSCRRRLAGHNKRRRKPQPDPLELQARLRSSLEDWPFFYQSKYPRLPFWQDAGEPRSNVLWPRKLMQYHDQPNLDYPLQTLGMDMFTKGSSASMARDKFPLLLLQSPKTYLPVSSCDPRVQDYLPEHLPELMGSSPMGNGLSLASSSSVGAGVFTGLEPTPVTEVTRVSDSGRALSLLSLHSQCSQAPDMVSLDLSGLSNTTISHNQHVQDSSLSSQQFLLQGQQPCCQGFSTTLSMASNLHLPDVREEAHVMNSDKDFYECSFLDNLHRHSGYEGNHHPTVLNMQMQGHDTAGQGKQTQDLMQLASFQVSNAQSQSSSAVYNLESSGAVGDSQFSTETFFLKF